MLPVGHSRIRGRTEFGGAGGCSTRHTFVAGASTWNCTV